MVAIILLAHLLHASLARDLKNLTNKLLEMVPILATECFVFQWSFALKQVAFFLQFSPVSQLGFENDC